MMGQVTTAWRRMAIGCGALLCAAPAAADQGTARTATHVKVWEHDSPQRANPPVERPAVKPCVIEIIDHGFRDFEPERGRIDAARDCPGPWQKVVLEMDGAVKGHQYDRIGTLEVGGVTLLRASTPEPSEEGVTWKVEKDLTGYAPLFTKPQDLSMVLGNVVNDTYTGVFQINSRVLFYPAVGNDRPAGTADMVVPLTAMGSDGTDTVGEIRLPPNAERLLLEVFATGSGGGCEEFWYYAVPADKMTAGESCKTELGPYREVQVEIDGELAGIAAPYPHIYTGGWGNPYLWFQIPAPRAFDIQPIHFDLTPFIGKMNDDKPHRVRLRVTGLSADSTGWSLLPNVFIWRDAGVATTRGELIRAQATPLALDHDVIGPSDRTMLTSRSNRRFVARGVLQTSRGRVETIVEQALTGEMTNRSSAKDRTQGIRGHWTDRRITSRLTNGGAPVVESDSFDFGFSGAFDRSEIDGARATTATASIYDNREQRRSINDKVVSWRQTSDHFDGRALYHRVPRDRRMHGAATCQTYIVRDATGTVYEKRIQTRDGRFVVGEQDCPGRP